MRGVFLWGMVLFASLQADVMQHLRKIPNKPAHHVMRNIDFIYMINLDQRPEKWEHSIRQLDSYGISPYRFSAINGWEDLTLEMMNDVGLKFSPGMEGGFLATSYHLNGNFEPSHELLQRVGQTYFCHCMARGPIAIALSHLSVLQDAFDSGYETIWIMEDDIDVLRDPRMLSDLIEELDIVVGRENWDVLFSDRDFRKVDGSLATTYWAARRPDRNSFPMNDYAIKKQVGKNFRRIGARFGTHSMIWRRSGIEKILKFYREHQIYFPYDMELILAPGIKLYAVLDDIVSNWPQAPSDNGGPYYLKKE